jgi:hypothetical protein
MKIIYFTNVNSEGAGCGICKMLQMETNLLPELTALGHDVTVVNRAENADNYNKLAREYALNGSLPQIVLDDDDKTENLDGAMLLAGVASDAAVADKQASAYKCVKDRIAAKTGLGILTDALKIRAGIDDETAQPASLLPRKWWLVAWWKNPIFYVVVALVVFGLNGGSVKIYHLLQKK